jgi:hypothetical protein
MRAWIMICTAAVLAVSIQLAQSQTVGGQDCRKRATQSEQIACLQEAIATLRLEMQALSSMRSSVSSAERLLVDRSLEAMIDRKIQDAMEPRLRLLQRP